MAHRMVSTRAMASHGKPQNLALPRIFQACRTDLHMQGRRHTQIYTKLTYTRLHTNTHTLTHVVGSRHKRMLQIRELHSARTQVMDAQMAESLPQEWSMRQDQERRMSLKSYTNTNTAAHTRSHAKLTRTHIHKRN